MTDALARHMAADEGVDWDDLHEHDPCGRQHYRDHADSARAWALRPEAVERAALAMFDAEWGPGLWFRMRPGEPVRKLFVERARIAITTALEDA